jgi:two-component sensor histidine kinase
VVNNGVGLNSDFDFSKATGLGLSIVRTLVTTELAGTIEMRVASAEDFAQLSMKSPGSGEGTVVELRVPLQY